MLFCSQPFQEREYYVLETRRRRFFRCLAVVHIPCGKTQEVYYDLLQSGQFYPLDSYRSTRVGLEKRHLLRKRFERLRFARHHRPFVLFV